MAIPHVIRAANRRPVGDVHRELRAVQAEPAAGWAPAGRSGSSRSTRSASRWAGSRRGRWWWTAGSRCATFTPPVEASVQYLLVESHPLIRPDVRTGAKRVGVGETGLEPRYRGAQGFLLDGAAEVSWAATRLEALKTAGLALDELDQVFFLAADGTARGEATFAIDNQGAPALALPTPGEPTFASVDGEPMFLTRDAEGRLLVPLGQGPQAVVVQDARRFSSALGLAFARLELPRAGVPASRANVEVRYPAEWIPLYEELAPSSRLHLLDGFEAVLLLLLLAGTERLLALAGLARRRRWLLAGLATALAALSGTVLSVGLLAVGSLLIALAVAAAVRRLSGWRLSGALAGLGAAVLVALVIAGTASVATRHAPEGLGSAPMNYASKMGEEPSTFNRARVETVADGSRRDHEGLPARITLPPGARTTFFARELLATDAPRPVFAVLVAARAVAALTALVALALLGLALVFRRDLAAGARAYRTRLLG